MCELTIPLAMVKAGGFRNVADWKHKTEKMIDRFPNN
jgi:hypothetical protein